MLPKQLIGVKFITTILLIGIFTITIEITTTIITFITIAKLRVNWVVIVMVVNLAGA